MRNVPVVIVLFLALAAVLPLQNATALTSAPQIVDATMPVNADIRSSVEAWLGLSAPAPLPYWAITYAEARGDETLVSIAALNISSPSASWRVVDSETVSWIGTVLVKADGTVELYSSVPEVNAAASAFKMAMPRLAGGGSSVRFPWKSGGTMMYGPRGVHAAGGGGAYATGFSAVDFLGGNDMGSGVAPSNAYAVASGTVDYVCADDTTTLIRTANGSEYYIYAHVLDNANLVMDHQFNAGGLIGSLKYGSFDDNCGWAEQADNHYHLHFGFQPASGSMRLEGCILNISSQKWTCGTKTVATGQFLIGGGGVGSGGSGTASGEDGIGSAITQPSFWDYLLVGVIDIWDKVLIQNMPSHTALPYTNVIYTFTKVFTNLLYILVLASINLFYVITIISWWVKLSALLAPFEMFALIWRGLFK